MCLKTPGQVLLLVLDTFNSEVRHPIESAQALFVRLDRTFENDVLFLTVSKLTNCRRYFREFRVPVRRLVGRRCRAV